MFKKAGYQLYLMLLQPKTPKTLISVKKDFIRNVDDLPQTNLLKLKDPLLLFTNKNSLIFMLLKIYVLETMSKESTRQPFWNPIYKTLSTNLLIPLENSESPLIQNQIEDSNMLSIKELTLPEKNQPVDPFTFVDFPEPETEKVIKCVKIELYPAHYQKKIFKKWLNTARYVYNKVVNETEKKKSTMNFKIFEINL
ncbi:hypothetical protein HK099_006469 [Clydaea vesicula]|uniref:Transposase putative helix-turn-helix domain-containing protein n=1 Tax=Clydaea vesicula TaxID=447962 RepID=A0AAD5U5Y7_9FUNG|nr:hypothetical protein HK099_006469 [Clydaea vesicula]